MTIFNSTPKTDHQQGFTLIEILFYIFLLMILFTLIIQALLSISRTFPLIDETSTVNRSAIFGMERIVREARNATDIDEDDSVFATTSSVLVLETVDENGLTTELSFYLSDNSLYMSKNGVSLGKLTSDDIIVTELWFFPISDGVNSEAVKIEMTVQPIDTSKASTTFYNTAVLRGSYVN